MKKIIVCLAAILLSSPSFAQLMSVTATLTDSDSQVWNNATCSIRSYNQTGQPSQYQGTSIPTAPSCSVNSSGLLSASLYNTSTLFPISAQYAFTICSNTSAPCSVFNSPVTATDMSTTLSGLLVAPRFMAIYGSRGYLDVEVTNPPSGAYYYNVTSTLLRSYNGSTWVNIGAGASGAVTFDQIGSGTNLAHGLVCGAGCVLSGTNGGFVNANEFVGNPITAVTGTGSTALLNISPNVNGDATATPSFWNFVTSTNTGSTSGITAGLACSVQHVFISAGNYTAFAWCNTSATALALYRSGSHALGAEAYTTNFNFDANGDLTTAGFFSGGQYRTATNCSSAASPAVCGSAAAGSFVIAAAATSVVVNTSAVTATSQIIVQPDSSLGTKLAVTCNTLVSSIINPIVTARTAATSFTVTIPGVGLITNPACYSYTIVN